MTGLTQWIPAAGTVLAAIITGLVAATLKHRWDSESEQIRWAREIEGRERQARLDAFSGYLASRPTRADLARLLHDVRPGGTPDLDAVANLLRLNQTRLLILLTNPEDRDIVEDDFRQIYAWLQQLEPRRLTEAPTSQAVVELARRLSTGQPYAAGLSVGGRRGWRGR